MRLRAGIDKEARQMLRDPFGLIAALAVPPVAIWLYSLLGLGPTNFSHDFRETHAPALIITLGIWLSALTIASNSLLRDELEGVLQRLSVTPFPPIVLVLSKFVVLAVVLVVQAVLAAAAARAFLGEEVESFGFMQETLGILAVGVVTLGLGLTLAGLLRSNAQISQTVTFLTLASLTLSGFLKPLADLGMLGTVASFLPFTLSYQSQRAIFEGAAFPATDLLLLGAWTLVLLLVAWALIHRRLRRPM